MTHHNLNSTMLDSLVEVLTENGFDGMAQAMEILLNEVMKLERTAFLGAGPYEHSEDRRGYANGFKGKKVRTRVGEMELRVPQVRGTSSETGTFYPQSLEKGLRSERALKLAIAEMYVQGVSTRKVEAVVKELCGLEVTTAEVSRAAQRLDEELEQWRHRPLDAFPYLVLDARYENVRHGGSVVSCAVLIGIGVDPNGKRSVLGVSVSLSEAEVHWRDFLASLQERGLHGMCLIVSDDHPGLRSALAARMPGVPWQRCQTHLQRNATAPVPRAEMQQEVHDDLKAIFYAPTRLEAERLLRQTVDKYLESAPKLASWIEENVPQGLTVFALPKDHQRHMRTSNLLERLNREIKRRTRVACLFPSESSLLRLVTAILIEVSDEWETGNAYLTFENP